MDSGIYDCSQTPYENSWAALDKVGNTIRQALEGGGFTHLILLSKGWNTSQEKSLEYFEKMLSLLDQEAHGSNTSFRPLVVGLTWHSDWVVVPFLSAIPGLASYGNKAGDADEIGYLWANWLIHRNLLPAAEEKGLPMVLVGHSFGARLLSRAVASEALLSGSPMNLKPSLLVSLQGAFSMNRFLSERWRTAKEGAPYVALTNVADRVVLTWSWRDLANPLAVVASGAKHSGGWFGYRRAHSYAERFTFAMWGAGGSLIQNPSSRACNCNKKPCETPLAPPAEVINASRIVKSHGDVADREMAELLWYLIRDSGIPVNSGALGGTPMCLGARWQSDEAGSIRTNCTQ